MSILRPAKPSNDERLYTAGYIESGACIKFAADGQAISIPKDDFENLSELSISVWFNPATVIDSNAAVQGLVVKNTTAPKSGDYWVGHALKSNPVGTGRIEFVHQGGGEVYTNTSTFSANTWHHIVATFKNGVPCKIYYNGVDDSYNAQNGSTIGSNSDPLYVGANHGDLSGMHYFRGKIDRVRIYSRELTPEEASNLYYFLQFTEPSTNLILKLDFDGVITDASPRGNNGTMVGSPLYYPEEPQAGSSSSSSSSISFSSSSVSFSSSSSSESLSSSSSSSVSSSSSSMSSSSSSSGTWNAWSDEKSIPILGSLEGDTTNYHVKFVLHYGSGTDYYQDIYLSQVCQTDFSDIRFADENNSSIAYWIESKTNGDSATVWVEIPSVPSSGTTIKLHYGNSATGNSFKIAVCNDNHDNSSWTTDFKDWVNAYFTPDLTVDNGDISNADNFSTFKGIIEGITSGSKAFIGGNHDFDNASLSDWYTTFSPTYTWLVSGRAYGSFDVGDYHVVVLDANYSSVTPFSHYPVGATEYHGYIPDGTDGSHDQLGWLTSDLAATSKKTIVFCHQPLLEAHLTSDFPVSNRAAVRSVLETSTKVVLVVHGHVHSPSSSALSGNISTVHKGIPYLIANGFGGSAKFREDNTTDKGCFATITLNDWKKEIVYEYYEDDSTYGVVKKLEHRLFYKFDDNNQKPNSPYETFDFNYAATNSLSGYGGGEISDFISSDRTLLACWNAKITDPTIAYQALKINSTATSGTATLGYYLASQTGKFKLIFNARTTSSKNIEFYLNNGGVGSTSEYGATYTGPLIKFSDDGYIKYYNTATTGWSDVQSYLADTWYTIELRVNILSHTYDIYIDGVAKLLGISFWSVDLTTLNAFLIRKTPTNAASFSVYLDDIRIQTYAVTEAMPSSSSSFSSSSSSFSSSSSSFSSSSSSFSSSSSLSSSSSSESSSFSSSSSSESSSSSSFSSSSSSLSSSSSSESSSFSSSSSSFSSSSSSFSLSSSSSSSDSSSSSSQSLSSSSQSVSSSSSSDSSSSSSQSFSSSSSSDSSSFSSSSYSESSSSSSSFSSSSFSSSSSSFSSSFQILRAAYPENNERLYPAGFLEDSSSSSSSLSSSSSSFSSSSSSFSSSSSSFSLSSSSSSSDSSSSSSISISSSSFSSSSSSFSSSSSSNSLSSSSSSLSLSSSSSSHSSSSYSLSSSSFSSSSSSSRSSSSSSGSILYPSEIETADALNSWGNIKPASNNKVYINGKLFQLVNNKLVGEVTYTLENNIFKI